MSLLETFLHSNFIYISFYYLQANAKQLSWTVFSMLMNRAVSSLISKADEQGCVESAMGTVYV